MNTAQNYFSLQISVERKRPSWSLFGLKGRSILSKDGVERRAADNGPFPSAIAIDGTVPVPFRIEGIVGATGPFFASSAIVWLSCRAAFGIGDLGKNLPRVGRLGDHGWGAADGARVDIKSDAAAVRVASATNGAADPSVLLGNPVLEGTVALGSSVQTALFVAAGGNELGTGRSGLDREGTPVPAVTTPSVDGLWQRLDGRLWQHDGFLGWFRENDGFLGRFRENNGFLDAAAPSLDDGRIVVEFALALVGSLPLANQITLVLDNVLGTSDTGDRFDFGTSRTERHGRLGRRSHDDIAELDPVELGRDTVVRSKLGAVQTILVDLGDVPVRGRHGAEDTDDGTIVGLGFFADHLVDANLHLHHSSRGRHGHAFFHEQGTIAPEERVFLCERGGRKKE